MYHLATEARRTEQSLCCSVYTEEGDGRDRGTDIERVGLWPVYAALELCGLTIDKEVMEEVVEE